METISNTYSAATNMPLNSTDANGNYIFHRNLIAPERYEEHQTLTVYGDAQRKAIDEARVTAPATVGELWTKYLELVVRNANVEKQLNALQNGMERVSRSMNEYADDQDFCDSYEDALNSMNSLLRDAGYTGWFEFEGRSEEVEVTVERQRVVRETTTVMVERKRGQEIDEDYAIDVASETDLDSWYVQDDHYNDSGYEVTDIHG